MSAIGDAFIALLATSIIVTTIFSSIYLELRVESELSRLPDLRGVAVYGNGTVNITLELWRGMALQICYIEVRTDNGSGTINVTSGAGSTMIGTMNVTALLDGFVNSNMLPTGSTAKIMITFNTTAAFSGKSYPVILYDCKHRVIRVFRFRAP